MSRPEQLPLLATATASLTCCARCDGDCGPGGRCRTCDKGEIPEPGGPAWRRWTRGIGRVVRRRLQDRGLGIHASTVFRALLLGDEEMPDAVRPLLEDIARLPISVARYHATLARAVLQSRAYAELRRLGMEPREADRVAFEIADEVLAARATRRAGLRIEEPEIERLRIEIASDQTHLDAAAEAEAQAAIDAAVSARVAREPITPGVLHA